MFSEIASIFIQILPKYDTSHLLNYLRYKINASTKMLLTCVNSRVHALKNNRKVFETKRILRLVLGSFRFTSKVP